MNNYLIVVILALSGILFPLGSILLIKYLAENIWHDNSDDHKEKPL